MSESADMEKAFYRCQMTLGTITPTELKRLHYDVYMEGWKACDDGYSLERNPHRGKQQQRSEAWRMGWEAAKKQREDYEHMRLVRKINPYHFTPYCNPTTPYVQGPFLKSIADGLVYASETKHKTLWPGLDKWVSDSYETFKEVRGI